MTVLGPIDGSELGRTLTHEHLFIDLLREYRGDGLLNDPQLAADELGDFRDAGGRTIVDCTSIGLGRDPAALAEVARASGVNVVMGTGHYRVPYIDRDRLDRTGVDALADELVAEIEAGVGETGVRPGIIGEIGCDRYLTAVEERSFGAAARAHRRSGLTITTHAARWPVGLPQLELLEEEGVDPRRVIIGHSDTVPDAAYHRMLAERGAWVEFDTIQGDSEYDTQQRVDLIRALADAGFADRILLSHDVCLRSHLRRLGGCG